MHRIATAASLVALLAHCSPTLDLPEGVRIKCTDDSECPSGQSCSDAGLCIAKDAERDPPQLANAAVNVTAARAGTLIEISFDASETLLSAPVVELVAGDTRLAARFESEDGLHVEFSYVPTGSEPEGGYVIVATLTDAAGNAARDLAVGTVTLDFTAPEVTSIAASRSHVTDDSVPVSVQVDTDEPCTAEATLTSGAALTATTAGAGTSHTFQYTATGSEAEVATDVVVTVADLAGNEASRTAAGAITFDFTDPFVESVVVLTPAVSTGTEIQVLVTLSEPCTPTVNLQRRVGSSDVGAPIAMATTSTGSILLMTYTVVSGDTDGEYAVLLASFVDPAGNAGAPEEHGPVYIDNAAPQITGGVVLTDNTVPVLAREGDTVTASFTATDTATIARLFVTLGGAEIQPAASTPPAYAYEYTVVAGDADGPRDVWATAEDEVGNSTTVLLGGVAFDLSAPALVPNTTTVELVTGSNNPLRDATEVTDGTTVRVTFVTTEPVTPPAVATSAPAALPFTRVAGDTQLFVFEHTFVAAAQPQGAYTISAQLADIAGNPATVALPASFTVDTVAPAAADVVTLDRIVYTRVPWGSNDTSGVKTFALRGSAGAVEAASTVIAYDGPNPGSASQIGQTAAAPDGSFGAPVGDPAQMDLTPVDRAAVYVTAADAAGNQSPAVAVRDVVWTTTMGYKERGSSFENPHSFTFQKLLAKTLVDASPSESDLPQDVADLGANLVTTGSNGLWNIHGTGSDVMSGRYNYTTTYDSQRGRVILFGGDNGTDPLGDTWEWDGIGWQQLTPPVAPDPRAWGAMAYSVMHDRIILFGGGDPVDPFDNKTWEWDGSSWHEVTPAGPSPDMRLDPAMAYDAGRARIVMFGGTDWSTDFDDTWEWDGGNWEQIFTNTTPPGRYRHAMTYDEARKRVVLYGGFGPSNPEDTWTYDGIDWERHVVTIPELDRNDMGLTYDAERERVVMFGGYRSGRQNDLWEWDGSSWQEVCTSSPCNDDLPTARDGIDLFFDRRLGLSIVVSGFDAGPSFVATDTWGWDGVRWYELATDVEPSNRSPGAFAYDFVRGRVVMYGGDPTNIDPVFDCDGSGDWMCNGTYEWNGFAWLQMDPATPPSPRRDSAMAFYEPTGQMILFGGSTGNDETWGYSNGEWTLLTSKTSPSGRSNHSMAYDRDRQRVVLFGGDDLNDTWEWHVWQTPICDNDVDPCWNEVFSSGDTPAGRRSAAMAYRPETAKMVLFGGRTGYGEWWANPPLNDTWEWDGSAWVQRCEGTPAGDDCLLAGQTELPEARIDHGLAYDQASGRLVLFGGAGPTAINFGAWPNPVVPVPVVRGDTWIWDGDHWIPTDVASNPTPRKNMAMTALDATDRVFLFGGESTTWEAQGGAWSWTSGVDGRPAHVMAVTLAAAGMKSSSIPRQVGLSFRAGGLGYDSGTPQNGATLWIMDGTWQSVDRNTADINNATTTTADLSWSTCHPFRAFRLFPGATREAFVATTPTAPNETVYGQIATDYAEMSLSYRDGAWPEDCADGSDNDGDSLSDCDDPDCAAQAECVTPGCPDACAGAGVGTAVLTGHTAGQGDDLAGACGGADAPDVSTLWLAPSDGTYTFTTENSEYDTVLYALDGNCLAGTELACDDNGLGPASSITLALTAGQAIILVVDGAAPAAAGSFVLNVSGP